MLSLSISFRFRARPNVPGITEGDTFIQPRSRVHKLGVTFDHSLIWEVNNKDG